MGHARQPERQAVRPCAYQAHGGDVNKIRPQQAGYNVTAAQVVVDTGAAPRATERNFDDYHLYTLPNPTTLHDRETKQVEFLRASGISARRLYVYDGAALSQSGVGDLRYQANYGTQSNHDVWTMLEFANSSANHLTDQAQRFVDESLEVKRSEEHTSELQSRENLVCRLL